MWKCRFARLPYTREVDANRCVPLILGHIQRWRETADASVGSDDVKPTESVHRSLDRTLQAAEVTDVNFVHRNSSAQRLDPCSGFIQLIGSRAAVWNRVDVRAIVDRDDVGAFTRQPKSMCAP